VHFLYLQVADDDVVTPGARERSFGIKEVSVQVAVNPAPPDFLGKVLRWFDQERLPGVVAEEFHSLPGEHADAWAAKMPAVSIRKWRRNCMSSSA
jgi:hypothetical protein